MVENEGLWVYWVKQITGVTIIIVNINCHDESPENENSCTPVGGLYYKCISK